MATMKCRDALLWPLAAGFSGPACLAWANAPADRDAWLEAIDSGEVLAWVNARNAEAPASLSSANNIPAVRRQGDYLYNFHRSARRPHGVWRRTTLEEYAKPQPSWEALLNLDELAREETRNLVFAGYSVHAPSERALVFLSSGGEDKVEMREFDLKHRDFVPAGFNAPAARLAVSWFGAGELLIATDTGPGSMTRSGYPIAVRRWKRGADMRAADVVLRGQASDIAVGPAAARRDGGAPAALLQRRIRCHEWERHLLLADGTLLPLDLPLDADAWLAQDWLVVSLRTGWTSAGQHFSEGSVLAAPLAHASSFRWRFHVLLERRQRRPW